MLEGLFGESHSSSAALGSFHLFTHATMLSLFSGETTFLTSTQTDGTNQSRTTRLLGDIWMLPSTADEEWDSPKRPPSTVAKLQLSSTCMQR